MIRRFLVCLSFCLLATYAQADNRITIGEILSIKSEILEEDRPYWVYLPDSYNDETGFPSKYPVLYLLDGDGFFHSATGLVQYMSAGIYSNAQIPEMIVVAIPNTDRTRDLTPTHSTADDDGKEAPYLKTSGGGDKFLRFIRDELQPKIDSTYRTEAFNILVGHSFGGLLAAHALLEPEQIFQAYIAIDPSLSWDDSVVLRRARSVIESGGALQGRVYLTTANTVVPGYDSKLVDGPVVEDVVALIQSAASPELHVRHDYYEAEDHTSVPTLSLYHGLLFVFDGYKPPLALFYGEPSALKAHFKRVSDRLGITLLPLETLVNGAGYEMLYSEQDVDKAIELFTLNTVNYPESSNVYYSLAEAYMVNGDKALAIANYEKSLELDSDNQNAVEQLETLRAE
jgi:predicted alpha/beta superfamily hydrolase